MKPIIKASQLFINRDLKSTLSKVLLFPVTRFFIAVIFLLPISILNNLFIDYVVVGLEDPLLSIVKIVKSIAFISLLIVFYRFYTKYIENREAFEFDFKNALIEFGYGILIGAGMIFFMVGVLYISGYYTVEETNSPMILINRIFRYAQGAFVEDLIFTIIMFRLIEEYFGTIVSYIFVTLLFGGMHMINDGVTISSFLFISATQITLLAPFILTRRIWMAWAVHLSWNYCQSGVFGMNNSGMAHGGFIKPIISGPEWMTGGVMGIEGSWFSLVVNLSVGIPILIYAFKNKQFVRFGNKSLQEVK